MKFFVFFFLLSTFSQAVLPSLASSMRGNWKLVSLTCNGQAQTLDKNYTLSFDGSKGLYRSRTASCTQFEPEEYQYVSDKTISIKSGVRRCFPNPCAADLPASECGKETNTHSVLFDVDLKGPKMVLSTNDPKAIDCTGPGQQKPAAFTLSRMKRGN